MWRLEVDPATDRARVEALPLADDGRRNFDSVDIDLIGLTPEGERWLSAVPDSVTGKRIWVCGRFDSSAMETLGVVTPNSARPEFSADGRWLAWGNWRGSDAHVLAVGTTNPAVRLHADGSSSVAFSPDNKLLMIGGATELRFHEQGSWRVLQRIPRQPSSQLPPHFAFTGDSRLCAVVLPPNRVLLLDTISGHELATLPAGSHFPVKAAFSPDQKQLAAVSVDHNLLIWDLEGLRHKLAELGLDW
jgi:WD40 repeat protein